jgi:hypothetical protein
MKRTKVFWINRLGERREHSMGFKCSLAYARNWWRENILECQGILSIDERRNTKLQFLEATPVAEA